MLIRNGNGLPDGDSDDPVLIAEPRGGTPSPLTTPSELAQAVRQLRGASTPVALDVERAQGFRYGADPYLIQVRREGTGVFLIDSHALPDLSSLQEGLNDVWLLHDCLQDLPNLRQVGLRPPSLFDTEVAARLLGMERFGLSAVAEQVLGLTLLKDHQASDWSVRPLPKDWLRYAALDVELLTQLYYQLAKRLDQVGRWEWAQQEFAYLITAPAPAPKPDRWRSLPGAGKLRSRRSLGVLKELWEVREDLARREDIAPGRLVRNSALVRAAAAPPRNRRALMSISEFRSPIARQFEEQWIQALARVKSMTEEELPSTRRTFPPGSIPEARHWGRIDEAAAARLGIVRSAVAATATQLGLAPEVLLAPLVQRYIAWAPLDPHRPSGDEVEERMVNKGARDWQIDLTLDPICDALGV